MKLADQGQGYGDCIFLGGSGDSKHTFIYLALSVQASR